MHMAEQTKLERIKGLLNDPLNVELVNDLVAQDATYVSLNFENAELKRIMPWAGTGKGPQTVLDTYGQVSKYWTNEGIEVTDSVESESSGGSIRKVHVQVRNTRQSYYIAFLHLCEV